MTDFAAQLAHYKGWGEETLDEYRRWVNSFGLESPSVELSADSVRTEQFKGVLPYEYFSNQTGGTLNDGEEDRCHTLLSRMLFPPHRTGDVYQHEIPQELIHPAGGLEYWDKPVGSFWVASNIVKPRQ